MPALEVGEGGGDEFAGDGQAVGGVSGVFVSRGGGSCGGDHGGGACGGPGGIRRLRHAGYGACRAPLQRSQTPQQPLIPSDKSPAKQTGDRYGPAKGDVRLNCAGWDEEAERRCSRRWW